MQSLGLDQNIQYFNQFADLNEQNNIEGKFGEVWVQILMIHKNNEETLKKSQIQTKKIIKEQKQSIIKHGLNIKRILNIPL